MNLFDRPVHAEGVVSRMIDGEAVLVHPGQGRVRVLNAVGARLWELADGQHTAGEVAEVVASEYTTDIDRVRSDALAFYDDLIERGVLQLAAQTGAISA
jgi:hypothetical protein